MFTDVQHMMILYWQYSNLQEEKSDSSLSSHLTHSETCSWQPSYELGLIPFEFGSGRREHAQCAARCLQSVEQLSRVWNSNMAEAVVSLPLTNLEWFQIASSHA